MGGTTDSGLLLLVLQPYSLADAERMEIGLSQLTAEDATLTVEIDRPARTATIGAIGELQLEMVVDRLKREFNVSAAVGRPRVAYRDLVTPNGPVRLEPVMRVEVIVPLECAAEACQDLFARRGIVRSQEDRSDRRIISAVVPLAELFGYDSDVRQRTRGRGTFSQQFDSYQAVRENPDATDDDRSARVRVPLKPVPPPRPSSIALPEPNDGAPET
jgi:translation elongation factor EF-G